MNASSLLQLRRANSLGPPGRRRSKMATEIMPPSGTSLFGGSTTESSSVNGSSVSDDLGAFSEEDDDSLPPPPTKEREEASEDEEAEEEIKWWKSKRRWRHICESISLTRGLHDLTIRGDFFFERYAHFWQLLRNVHFSKWLPAVLITRVFFRGVYLLVVGVKREDYYPWEWAVRESIRESFGIEASSNSSYFYSFYVDVLIEVTFIALISKANNATFNRALTIRLRNWQWLFLGLCALGVCIWRDHKLTQFFFWDPDSLYEKTKFIIHTIGTIIIALCDLILLAMFLYILVMHSVLTWHDVHVYRYHERQHYNHHLPASELNHVRFIDKWMPSLKRTKFQNTVAAATSRRNRSTASSADNDDEDLEADALPRRRRRESAPLRAFLRARTAAKNFNFVLRQRRIAPEYVFRESDQRSLLAALLHPPGACEGRFQASDLLSRFEQLRASSSALKASGHVKYAGDDEDDDINDGGIMRPKDDGMNFARRRPLSRQKVKKLEQMASRRRRDAARLARRTAHTGTRDVFGGLWSTSVAIDPYTGGRPPSQSEKKAMHLERLHLDEEVDEAWQERVKNRTYHLNARLLMAVVLGWLLAVAVTAGLAYGAWVLERYMDRKLNWIEDTIEEVDELLQGYLVGSNLTETTENLVDVVNDRLDDALQGASSTLESVVEGALEDAIEVAVDEFNVTADLNSTIVSSVATSVTNATLTAAQEFEATAVEQAARIIVEYLQQYYEYVEDYKEVLEAWVKIARRASSNFYRSGVAGASVAFVLMNYSLVMILARYREVTHRFRESGMIDDMDLIFDESARIPSTRSESFWILITAPSAPYAVAFVGNAVSNMLVISIMVMFFLFFILGIGLFPGAIAFAFDFLAAQIGVWRYIYPVVYMLDWFYLNSFIADRTYIIHRSCFDMWDFVIGIWKLITGLFGGIIRVAMIYIIATFNTVRIDWTIFAGRIGWLDIGYNSFASVVMLTERHGNPSLCAASRLVLSSHHEPYSRRTCAEHVLTFDVVAPSKVIDAAEDARDLPDLFERVVLDDADALLKVRRARLGLAWRTLHLVWILVANPSLVTWNVKKWREHPISNDTWRRARDKLRKRRERDRKKRRASAILEIADRELKNSLESTNATHSFRNWSDRATSKKEASSHSSSFTTSGASTQHSRSVKGGQAYARAIVDFAMRRRRHGPKNRTSVMERIDRLEVVLDDRLPADDDEDDDQGNGSLPLKSSFSTEEKREPPIAHESLDEQRLRRTSTRFLSAADEKQAIVAEPGEIADVLTRFQLAYLRTTFRLLDKDQDGLVSPDDLRFHYKSQGNVLTEDEARVIVDSVSVTRKGYYVAKDDSDLREVEKLGFDFPEFLAYSLWRLSSEEGVAIDAGVASGLDLNSGAREAVFETMFVRFKGLDERIVNMSCHVDTPLTWDHVESLIKRTRLDRGPFGIRRPDARMLFDILSMGRVGGDFDDGIESEVCKECGKFFVQNKPAAPENDRIDFDKFAEFFDTSIYACSTRLSPKDLMDCNMISVQFTNGEEDRDDDTVCAPARKNVYFASDDDASSRIGRSVAFRTPEDLPKRPIEDGDDS